MSFSGSVSQVTGLVGSRVCGAGLGVQVALKKGDGSRPGIQGSHSIFAQSLVLQERMGHVGIDFEFEGLSELLHIGCGSSYFRSQAGVLIASEGQHRSLYLGHRGEVRRCTVEADGGVDAGYLRSAFPRITAAIAETGDSALAVGAWQLERILPRRF